MMSTLHYCENIPSEIALNGISAKKKIYFDLNLQDENNCSTEVIRSISLRKPTDIEQKRHVLQRYQQLQIKAHELHQSPDEQTENQDIERENVQISQTTAPPPTTTIHGRNDHDIDTRTSFVRRWY
ncbi:unnamed protein product [Rotaria magnacalcarata]|uniref:Uncharacterized protein n=1 Tax=Rotaria magnacalcarata TaxID=392030 RepID=A0A816MZD8_9BILA|nr:unnamed protein product [Rotaria magnacalcarata]